MLQGKARGNCMITNIRNVFYIQDIEDYKHYTQEKYFTQPLVFVFNHD